MHEGAKDNPIRAFMDIYLKFSYWQIIEFASSGTLMRGHFYKSRSLNRSIAIIHNSNQAICSPRRSRNCKLNIHKAKLQKPPEQLPGGLLWLIPAYFK
jgi:hypothetical protein